jgi:hypothetical protein
MDFEGSRDVLHRLALRKELACQFPLIGIELSRSSKRNTAFSGSFPPGAGTFPDQIPLKFRDAGRRLS